MRLALLLAAALLVWFGLRGVLGPAAVVVLGAVAAFVLVRYGRAAFHPAPSLGWLRKVAATLRILLLFGWELLLSNVQQLRVVFGPQRLVAPHWLSFETELESPALRALLGMMISLTPGTLTVDIDDRTVWLHVLVAEDDTVVVGRVRRVLECPLRRLES